MNDKITVIIPVYNTEKYLEKCVKSVCDQTYKNLEVILVDDGSTDSSPEICDTLAKEDERIVVIHKQNGGLSSARNAGLDKASGDYIGFIDSDDFIAKDMYDDLYNAIPKEKYAVSNIMLERIDENGVTSPSAVPHTTDEVIDKLEYVKELMLHKGDASVCTKLFSKPVFENLRFCEGKLNEDFLFMLDVASLVDSINFVGKVGYCYFVRNGSITSGYGKSVIDMVGNSTDANAIVKKKFPELYEVADRFTLYQHMAYLLLIPKSEAHKGNKVYSGALKYIRKNIFTAITNNFLSNKNKLTIILLTVFPKTMAKLYSKKG